MRRTLQLLLVVCLVGTTYLLSFAADVPSLNMPGADKAIANPVPLNVIKAVALSKAKEFWGDVAAGEPIPNVDQDGKLTCYMVPFRIGGGAFPQYGEIVKEVKAGRKLVKDAKDGFISKEAAKDEPAAQSPDAQAPVISAAGPVRRENLPRWDPYAPDIQKAVKAAKAKEIGAGQYGTIYVAASYDKFPIPHITQYLPPFFVTGDLAKQKADQALKGSSNLVKIYFLGMRGTYFEFGLGADKKTIHAHSLEVKEIERAKSSGPPDPEAHRARITAEWTKLKEAAGVKEGGKS